MEMDAIRSFFNRACIDVSEQDIVDFSPGDPGYPNYVSVWCEIRRTGTPPNVADFDVSEVIGLTGWCNPDSTRDAARFRRYRRFTSAVALWLFSCGEPSEGYRVPNYVARDVLLDLIETDQSYRVMVRAAFLESRSNLQADSEWEYPFLTFGSLIISQMLGDWAVADQLAVQLIEEELQVRESPQFSCFVVGTQFLLGLTNFDQVHSDWVAFAAALKNPNACEEIDLIRDAIVNHPGSLQ